MENEFVAPQKLHFTPAAWAVLAAFAKELSARSANQDIGPILVQWVTERQYGDRANTPTRARKPTLDEMGPDGMGGGARPNGAGEKPSRMKR